MTESNFEARAEALRTRAAELAQREPKLRARNQAQALGVSEAELVAAGCGGARVTPLGGEMQALFRELGTLGEVMALTRNDWCVHERHGRYEGINATGAVGIVLGPDIDLRVFFDCWQSAWAVSHDGRDSIQFFDRAGVAVHKVYRTEATDGDAWAALVGRFTVAPVWPAPQPIAAAEEQAEVADAAAFRAAWLAMTDTHQFFPLLRKNKVSRLGALRAAGGDLAQRVPAETAERMLTQAAAEQLSIMCFVGNRGMIQIHTGPVENLRRTGPWFNVLDPRFNLHLDTTAIDQAWIVNKPTEDGWVTSLELYAASGELIVQFFGARKPGVPELAAWRALLSGYCTQPLAQ